MRLRAGRDDDLTALLALWVEAWSEVCPEIDFSARRSWFARHLAELEDAGADVTVACADDGRALGFVVFDPASGVMDQLCVAVDSKGAGVAQALLEAVKRRAPGGVHLTVNKANARAVRFYQREGFAIVGEAVNPQSGLPIWTMVWRLGGAVTRNREPLH